MNSDLPVSAVEPVTTEKSHPPNPLLEGENPANPPLEGENPANPLLEGQNLPNPPLEGENPPNPPLEGGHPHQQPQFKTEEGKLLLVLPPEGGEGEAKTPGASSWGDIWQQIKHRLNGGDRFWQPNTEVHLHAKDRLLDTRQLQDLATALGECQLQLTRIYTSRRQTAVAAATAGYSVEQGVALATFNANQSPGKALADPLYLETTVRSGVEIRHQGTVVIKGDVNPGGAVVADGDIIVWGRLRGLAHAGAAGNSQCLIMTLQMEPTQLRIADYVARAPESPAEFYPEVAYVSPQGIRIALASDLARVLQLAL
ncbi:septum site-determining protein MinC [[Phormidium] sp. ETS-05]|uniref:septum site-determining protein MinC n=1 Tax=[Phormidium] sp. ETS-05 TaxID=222819 RepID=UPI0018EED156|nr:septum site-determining protein MinC [[Phormidium] sp. ETS-05]